MIPLLVPLFRGALAPLGERLQCAPAIPPDAVCVEDLLRPGGPMIEVLRRHARYRNSNGQDLRPVASAWSLDYLNVLLPPVVAAASVLRHVFPMAAEQVWVRLDGNGVPTSFHIRAIGHARPGTGPAPRYACLLQQHLQPLFAVLCSLTRLAPKILWGNAARRLEPIFDQALALAGDTGPVAQDRNHLLFSANWPALHGGEPEPNPLFGRRRDVLQHDCSSGTGCATPIRLHR